MRKKKILCLWSGGLDSTAMVYKLLNEGHDVETIYVEILNNAQKTKAENRSRSSIEPHLRELAEKKNSKFTQATTVKVDLLGSPNNAALPQVPVWLFSLAMSGDLSQYDEVSIAYVMNDDAISYLQDIRDVFYAYKKIFHVGRKWPKLVFPMTKFSKREILDKIPRMLAELTWSCEYNSDKPCGDCHPCKRRQELGLDKDTTDATDPDSDVISDGGKEVLKKILEGVLKSEEKVPGDEPRLDTHEGTARPEVQEDIRPGPPVVEERTDKDQVARFVDSVEVEKDVR